MFDVGIQAWTNPPNAVSVLGIWTRSDEAVVHRSNDWGRAVHLHSAFPARPSADQNKRVRFLSPCREASFQVKSPPYENGPSKTIQNYYKKQLA
jgi:hypothetical protein